MTADTCPILLLQGLDDPIVPPAQAESIAADLAAHGTRYSYLAFEGESHGFRKAENVTTSYEAELSFYGQILGFEPPGIPKIDVITPGADSRTATPGRTPGSHETERPGQGRQAARCSR